MESAGLPTVEPFLVSPLIPSQNSDMIAPPQPEIYLPTHAPSQISTHLSYDRALDEPLVPLPSPEESSPQLPLENQLVSEASSVSIADTLLSKNTITGVPEQEDSLTNSMLSLSQPSTTIDFEAVNFSSYAQQDKQGSYQVQNEGDTVKLSGNTWKKIDFPYQVTSNTVLEFDFLSTGRSEIQGIGLDTDNRQANGNLAFMLNGTQSTNKLNQDFLNNTGSDWKTYTINLGQYDEGQFNYLLLINDRDKSNPTATSYFRNVRLYETQDTPLPTQGKAANAIPVWHSGFENGFPGGEWHKYDDGSYSPVNKKAPGQTDTWTVLNKAQAAAEGVSVVEGDNIYKGWIHGTTGTSHRAYPVLHLDQINSSNSPNGIPSPIVNRFYVWADWQTNSKKDWMHFLTLGNDPRWDVVTMSARGPDRRLVLAHAGLSGRFDEGNGSEQLNEAYMPLRQWVRFTVYVDFRAGHDVMYVWMDGKPIFRANGGNIDQDSPNLLRAHWGLYSRGSLNNGVQYNDSIQLWRLTKPLTNFSQEPISPYDGAGKSYKSTVNSDQLSLSSS